MLRVIGQVGMSYVRPCGSWPESLEHPNVKKSYCCYCSTLTTNNNKDFFLNVKTQSPGSGRYTDRYDRYTPFGDPEVPRHTPDSRVTGHHPRHGDKTRIDLNDQNFLKTQSSTQYKSASCLQTAPAWAAQGFFSVTVIHFGQKPTVTGL